MKINKIVGTLMITGLLAVFLCGCGKTKEPINLTVWHVYGAQTDSPMNAMVDEFNETVGKEKGITIQVTHINNTNSIHEAVLAAANNEPGAAELPDIFVSYPKTVLSMPNTENLVDFNDYFTQEEMESYIPAFVEEGEIDDKLVVFPIAKSTEILFVNKTLFDRFAKETGAKLSDLETWEGLYDTAVKYYRWTDAKTPEVENDGATFFVHDYHFNHMQVGAESLGNAFFSGETISFDNNFEKVWTPYAKAAIQGGVWLQGGYATEAIRTGNAISSVASSASVLYYEDVVTYPNNVSEDIEVVASPIPVFKDGNKLVMQRGAGLCVTKSNKEREEAAITFIKWITKAENNVRFVTKAGYMPVTQEGFEQLPAEVEKMDPGKYKSLYEAFLQTQKDYDFYTPPQFSGYLDLETNTESKARNLLKEAREEYLEKIAALVEDDVKSCQLEEDAIADRLAKTYMNRFIEEMK